LVRRDTTFVPPRKSTRAFARFVASVGVRPVRGKSIVIVADMLANTELAGTSGSDAKDDL